MRVLKKIRKYHKQGLAFALLFVLSLSTFVAIQGYYNPDTAKAYTLGEYTWKTAESIYGVGGQEPGQTFTKIEVSDPVIKNLYFGAGGGYQTGCAPNDCDYYKGNKSWRGDVFGAGMVTDYYVIFVEKGGDKLKGYHNTIREVDSNKGVYSWLELNGEISIKDPDKVAPPPAKKVSVGSIIGKVYKEGDWQTTDFDENVVNEEVKLVHDNGTEVSIAGHGPGSLVPGGASKIHPDHHWEKYDLDANSALYEGRYSITFHSSEQGSCSTGNAQSGGDAACTITLDGKVSFDLSAEANGSGKITLVGNDGFEQASPANGKTTEQLATLSPDNGLRLNISYKLSSPLDGIMENAMAAVLGFINVSIKTIGGWINSILNYGNNINNSALIKVWTQVRNISLSLLTLGILIIAFANILHIDIERYGINRMIPRLVMAIVMSYFSFLLIRFLLEIASSLQALALGGSSLDASELGGGKFSAAFSGDVGAYAGSIGLLILLFFIGFIVVIAMLWLLLVLIVRIAVLWFLVAVSPLAFIMMVMPFTENLYKQWWEKFWKWAFMGPAIAFMLYMTNIFLKVGFGASFSGAGTASSMDQPASWIFLLLGAAGIFIAASIPFAMGGEVYSGIKSGWSTMKGVGKGAGGLANRLSGNRIGNALALRKGSKESAMKLKSQQAQARRAQGGAVGRFMAGTTKNQAKMLEENLVTATSQEHGMANMDEKGLKGLMSSDNQYVARAAARTLASRKRLGANIDGSNAARVNSLLEKDGALNASTAADNRDAYAAMASNGLAKQYDQRAKEIMASTSPKDWKGAQWKYANKSSDMQKVLADQMKSKTGREAMFKDMDQGGLANLGQVMRDNPGLYKDINSYGASIKDPAEQAAFSDQMRRVQEAYTTHVSNISGGKGPLD